jgi:ribosome-binding protein aMBF1 (putative translation factor)
MGERTGGSLLRRWISLLTNMPLGYTVRLMVRVGRNVKRVRRQREWTQKTLAARIGTSQVYVAQVEAATKELSLEMLGRFAKALKVKPGELLQ